MKAPIRNTRGRERNPRWLRPLLHRRTRRRDPTEQLLTLGVPEDRIYIDRGFSGTTRRNRAGLDQALAAVWNGSVFTVTKFDRFARNMAEANDILTGLSGRVVLFGLGASVYDWNDPFGRLFLQTLAMVAEFEANLGHMRTREGMALAKKNGKLKGKQPKLREPARRSIRRRYAEGEVSLADLATEYSVGRSTIHGIVHGPETSKWADHTPKPGVNISLEIILSANRCSWVPTPESARKNGKAVGGATVTGEAMLSMALHLRDEGLSLREIAFRLVITQGAKSGRHPSPATVMRMLRDVPAPACI